MTDKLEPAGRLVGQKLSGGKAPLPDLAEGRASGLFQRIADGAPVAQKGYWGANSDPTAGRGKKAGCPSVGDGARRVVRRTREALRARAAVRCSRGEATAKRQRRQGSFRRKLTQPARVADSQRPRKAAPRRDIPAQKRTGISLGIAARISYTKYEYHTIEAYACA